MLDDELLGKQVGNYVIARLIGRGGMGEVYLAEHPKISRQVALKVLSRDLAAGQLADRFLTEARAMSRIAHPNVVQVFDFGALDDGRLYYMMEVLQGKNLNDVLRSRGTLTPAESLPYVEQICAGLQAAHERGVVHRDLKPENVFVIDGPRLELKLLDFGIAKLLETEQNTRMTSTGVIMGTPVFIAPEQAAGKPHQISPRTDLYSLGVMIYAMLAGQPPFSADSTAVLLAKHIMTAPPPLRSVAPQVPPAVAAVVERCLEKDPAGRYASAAELCSAFAAAVAAPPPEQAASMRDAATVVDQAPPAEPRVASTPPGAEHRTTMSGAASEVVAEAPARDGRRSRWPVIAAGAAVAVLAGGGVALMMSRSAGRGETSGGPARPVPAADAAPRSAARLAPDARRPAGPRRHKITVRVGGQRATCTVDIEGTAPLELKQPCRFEADDGRRVRLEVRRPGHEPFVERWHAVADRIIDVVAHVEPRKSARPATPPIAKAKTAPATPPPKPEPKAEPVAVPKPEPKRKVGEGTMGLQ